MKPGRIMYFSGYYTCELNQAGNLHMHFRAYDMNNIANYMGAINANDDDVSSCTGTGGITANDPYVVDIIVDLTTQTEVTNNCEMIKVSRHTNTEALRCNIEESIN